MDNVISIAVWIQRNYPVQKKVSSRTPAFFLRSDFVADPSSVSSLLVSLPWFDLYHVMNTSIGPISVANIDPDKERVKDPASIRCLAEISVSSAAMNEDLLKLNA
jgi:hypothetical protein